MVLAPAGLFLMGSGGSDPKAGDDEKPQHTVSLEAFWIDRLEVASAHYARFLNAPGEHCGACGGHGCIETQEGDPTGTTPPTIRSGRPPATSTSPSASTASRAPTRSTWATATSTT